MFRASQLIGMRQSAMAGARRHKVCVLGAKGAGKTCFLAGLAVLSEPNRNSPITLIHEDTKTADYLDSLRATLRRGVWPPPTTATVILDMTVVVDGVAVDMRVVDYAGEDFTGALRILDRDSVDELYRFSREADVFLLLFAPHLDLVSEGKPKDVESLVERQRAHLQAIAAVWREQNGQAQPSAAFVRPELGLVITQCDRVPGLNSPRAAKTYLDSNAPHFVQRLGEFSSLVKCFAVSAIGLPLQPDSGAGTQGSDGDSGRVSPFGYEPLFRWIRGSRRRRSWWRKTKFIGAVAVVGAFVVVAPFVIREMTSDKFSDVLNNSTLTDIEKVLRVSEWGDGGWLNNEAKRGREEYLSGVISTLDEGLNAAATEGDFQRLRKQVEELEGPLTVMAPFDRDLGALSGRLKLRERSARLKVIEDGFIAQPRPRMFVDDVQRFIDDYASGDDVDKVREMLKGLALSEMEQRRDTLKNMPLGDSKQVAAKAAALSDFAREFERQLAAEEVAGMRKAAELARLACGQGRKGQWRVTVVRTGGMRNAYQQDVELLKGGGETVCTFKDGGGPARDKTWTAPAASITWQAGESLKVLLVIDGWWDVRVGYLKDDGPMAIGLLVGKQKLNVDPDGAKYVNDPYAEFQLIDPRGVAVTEEDWNAVEEFIFPGTRL